MNIVKQVTNIEGEKDMYTNRMSARAIGVLFIAASASAILGLLLYEPILTGDYLVNGAENATQIALGALMELVLALSAIGTAIGLFPVLRPYGERVALGHIFFRFFEAVLIVVGVVSVLSLLTLSKAFVTEEASNTSAYQAAGTALLAIHDWTFMLGPLFMLGVNTIMYSSLLYKSKLVPRPLSIMGMTGAVLVFSSALLILFDVTVQNSTVAVLLAMTIAFYEMILAGWLIVKGFNRSVSLDQSAPVATNPLFSAT